MGFRSESDIVRLADQLERSFRGGAWHGPSTREALAGIDASTAGRRPAGSSHTILEHVRHMTFWLKAANVRITEGQDVDPEGDWSEDGAPSEAAWSEAIAELDLAHSKLHQTLLDLDDDRLEDTVPGSDPTVRGLLLGTLQHNAYHTGQIVQISRELSR